MAETIRIEIPIEAKDKTASGVTSAQRRLSAFERSIEQLERKLGNFGKGVKAVDLEANDNVTGKIDSASDAASALGRTSAVLEIDAHDSATDVISGASDAAGALNGESAVVDIDADDSASGPISDVSDATSSLNGETAIVDIVTDDSASGPISDVTDAADALNGTDVVVDVTANDNATEALQQIQDLADSVSGGAQSAMGSIGGKVAAAAGFAGISLGIGSALTTFKDFEAGMSQVSAISGATGKDLEALTAKAKEMGATTKFTATESAEAFNYMAMAGWKPQQMLAGIEPIMNLAAASGESLAAASGESLGTVSDIVTDALTAFGLKAEDAAHFSDILASAAANSNTNVAMLGESFKYAAPVAGAMGYSADDTAIALGLMANAGIKASMGGTALRRAFTNLSAPSDKVKAAMDKYGISLKNADGSQKSLMEVMQNLRESLGGIEDATEQSAAAATLFGNNAMAGMLAIVNAAPEDFDKLSKAIYNCDGATDRMAATMMDNMQGSLTLLSSAAEATASTLGEGLSPYVTELADGIAGIMPPLSDIISDWFDSLDQEGILNDIKGITDGIRQNLTNMLNSDEWKEADAIGKINLAWDKIIVEPLQEWADSDGKGLIGAAITGMFSSVGNILSGNGQLTDWIGVGALAMTVNTVVELLGKIGAGVDGAISSLSGFKTMISTGFSGATAGGFVAAAVLAAAAIWGINEAIEHYNQLKIEKSLDEHFGDLSLTAEQISAIAAEILNVPWKVNVELALNEVKNADEVRKGAETYLENNQKIEFKALCGVTLDVDDKKAYAQNVQGFIDARQAELDGRSFSASLLVNTMLSTPEGEALSSAINSWTLQDNLEMSALSAQLTQAVDAALSDGILTVDEQAHIAELQGKIDNILSRWKQYESKAESMVIRDKYGRIDASTLEAGSFMNLMDELTAQRETNSAYLDESSKSFYAFLEAAKDSGRLDKAGLDYDTLISQWQDVIRSEKAKELANSVDTMNATLESAYSQELEGSIGADANYKRAIRNFLNPENSDGLFSGGNVADNIDQFVAGTVANPVDKGLESLYQSMKPTVQALGDFIDSAFDESGNQLFEIPQQIMDKYSEAIEIGAASGDWDAGTQLMANEILKSGNEALIDGIMNGDIEVSDELAAALRRSMAKTGDGLSMEGVKATLEDIEVTQESVENVQQSVKDFMSAVEESGSTAEYTADGVEITLGEVDVDGASAAQQVADALGITIDELAEIAGVEPVELEPEMTITIPEDKILAEGTEAAAQAVEETAQAVNDAYDEPIETEGEADVTLDQTNNADEIYDEVGQEITQKFNDGYEVSNVPVRITLDYQITNPTATISVGGSGTMTASGAGSVQATVASANGRFVDSPMLSWVGEDGPEFIIPVGSDKASRGLELWEQAGIALGAFGGFADGGLVGGIPYFGNVDRKPDYSQYLGMEGGSSQGSGSTPPVTVTVSMGAPSITVNDSGDSRTTAEEIRNILMGMTDQISNEVGNRLNDVFGNMAIRR